MITSNISFTPFLASSSDILIMPMVLLFLAQSFVFFSGFAFFSIAFQFRMFLLTSLQVHWSFPWLCQVYWCAHGSQSSFLLLCYWFLEFPFDSSLKFPTLPWLMCSFVLSSFPITDFSMLVIVIITYMKYVSYFSLILLVSLSLQTLFLPFGVACSFFLFFCLVHVVLGNRSWR